jgi:uncharacterized Zn finger protein
MRFAEGFPGRPRKVEGGIQARSKRGAIGDTWWSQKFIGALEAMADKGRLSRGRSYARAGQVLELTIAPGLVTARVQGSRPKPYAVSIAFAAVSEPAWGRIERRLAGQARFAAHLLAGQVPHELVQVFGAEGVSLFPTASLELICSCPDWGWPCKHVAATCYLLAEAFDEDPFQLLRWRGRDRETLLAHLRELRGGAAPAGGSRSEAAPVVGTAAALAPPAAAAPVEELLGTWWSEPAPLPEQPTPGAPDVVALRQLPQPSAYLGGEELSRHLGELYRRLVS